MVESEPCPSCAATGKAFGLAGDSVVFVCPRCDLSYFSAAVRHAETTDGDWWQADAQNGGVTLRSALDGLRPQFGRQLTDLERLTDGRRLLDVGAGGGLFVAAANERGWTATGVDANLHAAAAAKAAFGLEYAPDLGAAPNNAYDVVRLSHVLEHVAEPVAFLSSLQEKLAPGGVMVVILPNARPLIYSLVNAIRRLRGGLVRLAMPMSPGFHILGLSPRSLSHLTAGTALGTIEMKTVSMGDPTYYPWFYDGLLRRVPLSEIPLKTLVRYWLPLAFDALGNPFGRGQWLVGFFRKK